jgi:hypothetical protein
MAVYKLIQWGLIALSSTGVPALAAPAGTNSALVGHCTRKWAGDPSMIQYCIRNQVTEYVRAERTGTNSATLEKCKARYGSDYSMVNACIRNEERQAGSSGLVGYEEEGLLPEAGDNPPTFVNGVRINTCSSGVLCFGQMMDAIRMRQ